MIHRLMCFLALIFTLEVLGQNLIPNPSFEDTICHVPGLSHPGLDPFFNPAQHWFNPNAATPDNYTTTPSEVAICGHNSIYDSDWASIGEWQYPKEGERMVGLWLGNQLNTTREFLECRLLEPLVTDTQYCFKMYVSLGNWQNLAIDRIGAFFSIDSVYDHSWAGGFEYEESMYVTSPAGIFLTDTAEWTLIEGVYTAQGGEEFLLIGNAFDDSETSYLTVNGSGNGWDVAYYFVDDLHLETCSTVGLVEAAPSLSFNSRQISADRLLIKGPPGSYWRLYDLSGRVAMSGQLDSAFEELSLNNFSPGIYLMQWHYKGDRHSEKLHINR